MNPTEEIHGVFTKQTGFIQLCTIPRYPKPRLPGFLQNSENNLLLNAYIVRYSDAQGIQVTG